MGSLTYQNYTTEELINRKYVPPRCQTNRICQCTGCMSDCAVLQAKPDQDLMFVRNMNIISRYFVVRWSGHVARTWEIRGVYRALVGKPEGKRPHGRPRRRWEDNIKMDLQEVGSWTGLIWLSIVTGGRDLVNAVVNLRVLLNGGISSLPENQLASQEGFCPME